MLVSDDEQQDRKFEVCDSLLGFEHARKNVVNAEVKTLLFSLELYTLGLDVALLFQIDKECILTLS